MEKKSNHRANVVRLTAPRLHTNADSLELFDIEGYQVVSKKGTFKEGELAVYVQPDSVVPQTEAFKWIWQDHVGLDGTVPEKRRRITVKKLRGEYSEGLLMPISDFLLHPEMNVVLEGDDVSDRIGITHYDPDRGTSTQADTASAPRTKRKRPTTVKGWLYFILWKLGIRNKSGQSYAIDVPFHAPVYDVEALKNFKNVLQEGELVTVTEKIHGSNARYVFVDGEFYCGSRTQWKKKGDNVWWKATEDFPGIELFCRKYPGYILYGECVPTQGSNFLYGFIKGSAGFFAFDILSPDGKWIDPRAWVPFFTDLAPMLYQGPMTSDVLRLADGRSAVMGASNQIREGCVIRPVKERSVRGLGRVHLKLVSSAFLEKDGK